MFEVKMITTKGCVVAMSRLIIVGALKSHYGKCLYLNVVPGNVEYHFSSINVMLNYAHDPYAVL